MKRKEGIDIPADIATGIQGEPKQPDIAKLEIEADILGQFPVPPLVGRETQRPAASSSTERPVMEVIVGNIQLKVTNEIEPRMLVETIRLLRGCEC